MTNVSIGGLCWVVFLVGGVVLVRQCCVVVKCGVECKWAVLFLFLFLFEVFVIDVDVGVGVLFLLRASDVVSCCVGGICRVVSVRGDMAVSWVGASSSLLSWVLSGLKGLLEVLWFLQ